MMRRAALSGVWLALAVGPAGAQEPAVVEVPFEADFGLVWVAVGINGTAPRWFLLDTGFEYSLLDATVARELALRVEEPRLVPQPGGAVETGAVRNIAFDIGAVRVPALTVQAMPLTSLESVVGRSLHGILGHDVIARYVLTIDHDRRVLTFRPAEDDPSLPDGAVLPLAIIDAEPFVEGVIHQPHRPAITGMFKLDTGSLDAVGLNRSFLENADVLAPDQATLRIPGVAVGGETDGLIFRVGEFRLGPYAVQRPVIGATLASAGFENRADAGTVGAEVLRRFTITLDYARHRMVLAPGGQYDAPPAMDRGGLWVIAEGTDHRDFRVRFVLPDGPAAAAGVRVGDRILGVDGRSAGELRLVDLWNAWRRPAGTVVQLEVGRGNERRSVRLVLRSPV
jgi:hypothetical protein